MVTYACNLSILGLRQEDYSSVGGKSGLHSEFQTSWGYSMRPKVRVDYGSVVGLTLYVYDQLMTVLPACVSVHQLITGACDSEPSWGCGNQTYAL